MRNWLWKHINRSIPLYIVFPAALCVLVNVCMYYGVRLLLQNSYHYDFTTFLDRLIPFHPGWVSIYLLAFPFWIVGYIMVGRQGKEHWYRFVTTDMIAKLICGLIFLILPTTNVRPEVTGDGLMPRLMTFVYENDAATELFPSIHCLESWLCYLGVRGRKTVSETYRGGVCIFAVLVCASTQFTKQHYLIDIAGAVAIAELCWFLVTHTECYRPVARLSEAATRFLFGMPQGMPEGVSDGMPSGKAEEIPGADFSGSPAYRMQPSSKVHGISKRVNHGSLDGTRKGKKTGVQRL